MAGHCRHAALAVSVSKSSTTLLIMESTPKFARLAYTRTNCSPSLPRIWLLVEPVKDKKSRRYRRHKYSTSALPVQPSLIVTNFYFYFFLHPPSPLISKLTMPPTSRQRRKTAELAESVSGKGRAAKRSCNAFVILHRPQSTREQGYGRGSRNEQNELTREPQMREMSPPKDQVLGNAAVRSL